MSIKHLQIIVSLSIRLLSFKREEFMKIKNIVIIFLYIVSCLSLFNMSNISYADGCSNGEGQCVNEGEEFVNPKEGDEAGEATQDKASNEIVDFPLEGNIYKDTGNNNELVKEYNPYSGEDLKSYAPGDKIEKFTRTENGVVVKEYVIKDNLNNKKQTNNIKEKERNINKTLSKETLNQKEKTILSENYLTALIMKARENGGKIITKDDKNFINKGENFVIMDFENNPEITHVEINGRIGFTKGIARGDIVEIPCQELNAIMIEGKTLKLSVIPLVEPNYIKSNSKIIDKKELKRIYDKAIEIEKRSNNKVSSTAPDHHINFEPTNPSSKVPTSNGEPTKVPTEVPTSKDEPTPAMRPTQVPTEIPTSNGAPTSTKTSTTNYVPTPVNGATPTQAPTKAPTQKPTQVPTQMPTRAPTQVPTSNGKPTSTKTPKQTPNSKMGSNSSNGNFSQNKEEHKKFIHHKQSHQWFAMPFDSSEGALNGE